MSYITSCYNPCYLLLYQMCPIIPHVMTPAIYYFTRCVLYYPMLWLLLFTTLPDMSYITPCYDPCYLLLYQICPILPHAMTLAIYYFTRYVLYYSMLWPTPCYGHLLLYLNPPQFMIISTYYFGHNIWVRWDIQLIILACVPFGTMLYPFNWLLCCAYNLTPYLGLFNFSKYVLSYPPHIMIINQFSRYIPYTSNLWLFALMGNMGHTTYYFTRYITSYPMQWPWIPHFTILFESTFPRVSYLSTFPWISHHTSCYKHFSFYPMSD